MGGAAGGRRLALAAAAGLLLVSAPAAADREEGWSYELWNELMSPFCPGRTLADCPSGQAEDLRLWIVEQERQGRAKEEVARQVYDRFGDIVLAAPRASGFGLAAYLVPVLLFLAGGGLVFVFLGRQTRQREAGPPEGEPPPDPEALRRIDEELSG